MQATFGKKWKETIVLWFWQAFYSKEWYDSEVTEITKEEKEKIKKWEKFEIKNKKLQFKK